MNKDTIKNIIIGLLALMVVLVAVQPRNEEPMAFSELMQKMAGGETLTPSEQQELLLEARRMEEVASLITSMIRPGTQDLQVNNLTANNINVSNDTLRIDQDGLTMVAEGQITKNNAYKFVDANGVSVGGVYAYASDADNLDFVTLKTNGQKYYGYAVVGAYGDYAKAALLADGDAASPAPAEIRVIQDANVSLSDFLNIGFVMMHDSVTPPTAIDSGNIYWYIKGSKLVFAYNDAGTARYKYLDLAGTTVTWVHTTVAP